MLMVTACSSIARPAMWTVSPNGIAANATTTGNRFTHGASVCKKRSTCAGMRSSLVRNFSGSAISVLTRPAPAKPKMLARFAPMRSWMRALPLRSIHPSIPARPNRSRMTTTALRPAMAISIPMRHTDPDSGPRPPLTCLARQRGQSHSRAPFRQTYSRATNSTDAKSSTSTKPNQPRRRKTIAYGYRKTTSTSKTMNRMAVR